MDKNDSASYYISITKLYLYTDFDHDHDQVRLWKKVSIEIIMIPYFITKMDFCKLRPSCVQIST